MSQENRLFCIGEKIDIIREDGGELKSYSSQILDIIDEGTFIINGPIYKNSLVFLYVDEVIDIICTKENKGKYKFSAIVEGRTIKKIYSIKIKKIGNVKKIQQREYYRFDISVPVKKVYIANQNKDETNDEKDCKAKDISGNGMKLMCNFKHSVGDRIICNFSIDNNKLSVNGEVVRIEKTDAFNFKYSIGIKFLDIEAKDRDIIVGYIFKEERKLRNKGLI